MRSFISRGRRGTLSHFNMFHDVSRVVLCGGAKLLLHFQKMRCIFRGRRSTLDTCDLILRGRRRTFDVWRCDFCANRIVRAASTRENVHIPWKVWHFWASDENGSVMSGVSPRSAMPGVSSQECLSRSVLPRVSCQECLPKSVFPRVSSQECLPRVSSQKCLQDSVFPRVSCQECYAKSVSQECLPKSVSQECLPKRVFPRVSCPECPPRVSCQECPMPRVSPKSVFPRVSPRSVFPRGSSQESHECLPGVSFQECHVRSVGKIHVSIRARGLHLVCRI